MYRNIYCPLQRKFSGSYYTTPARCIKHCRHFPCEAFSSRQLEEYIQKGYLETTISGFKKRRVKMYLFKKKDGSIVQAPDTFDQQNPDWKDLKEVEEILVVSKILVPQIRLVSRSSYAPGSEASSARKTAKKNRG